MNNKYKNRIHPIVSSAAGMIFALEIFFVLQGWWGMFVVLAIAAIAILPIADFHLTHR